MPFTLPLHSSAPDFDLRGVDGKRHSLASFGKSKLLVVVFSCNHCPFVIGSENRMIRFYNDFYARRVAMVAINSNESKDHPEDSLEQMVTRAAERGFPFPYLRDETQATALAYGALRTPHFYVFDADRKLRYTGRMDDNPRTPGGEATHELRDAVEALLAGKNPPVEVTNPIGCNIKWWGKPAKWMPPEACDLV